MDPVRLGLNLGGDSGEGAFKDVVCRYCSINNKRSKLTLKQLEWPDWHIENWGEGLKQLVLNQAGEGEQRDRCWKNQGHLEICLSSWSRIPSDGSEKMCKPGAWREFRSFEFFCPSGIWHRRAQAARLEKIEALTATMKSSRYWTHCWSSLSWLLSTLQKRAKIFFSCMASAFSSFHGLNVIEDFKPQCLLTCLGPGGVTVGARACSSRVLPGNCRVGTLQFLIRCRHCLHCDWLLACYRDPCP